MSNVPRIWFASLAVALTLALTACFGAAALASEQPGGLGGSALLAPPPKASHKPKPTPISLPTPTPGPTPIPTLRPTAVPTPTATPRPTATPAAPDRTATPTPKPTAKPAAAPAAATPAPKSKSNTRSRTGPSAVPAVGATSTGAGGPGIATVGSGPGTARVVGSEPRGLLVAIGFLIGIAMIGAWFALGRRRSSSREEVAVTAGVGPGGAVHGATSGAAHGGRRPLDDSDVPRWRRESVRRERAWTPPPRAEAPRPARDVARFDDALSGLAACRTVGQDGVRLLNVPHDVLGTPLSDLDRGRDVEVLEMVDAWTRVRTAWGEEGWVPSAALHP